MHRYTRFTLSLLLTLAGGAGIGLIAARGAEYLSPGYVVGDYSQQREQTQHSVILLGTAWCGYCKQARAHLQAQGVAFADLDIERSSQALAWHSELKADGVPVILVGDRQIRGFDREQIDAAIAALRPQTGAGGSR